jgi:hypothetical protein
MIRRLHVVQQRQSFSQSIPGVMNALFEFFSA